MMSYSLQVAGRSRVVVGRTVEELPRLLPQGRVIVLTDRNVARCRPELFEDCDPICMEPGEEYKTLQTVEAVCRELIRRGADRTTFLLGVGGGIVTDVTGFVASVYMRGVPFGFVSTTLLGWVQEQGGRFRPAAVRRLRHVALRDASPAGDSRRTGRGGQGGDHRRRTALRADRAGGTRRPVRRSGGHG
mgnify:CR=1 FL=1